MKIRTAINIVGSKRALCKELDVGYSTVTHWNIKSIVLPYKYARFISEKYNIDIGADDYTDTLDIKPEFINKGKK